jgi:2-haloacid dehalogenase
VLPRRTFLDLATVAGAATLIATGPAPVRAATGRPGGVAFDAFALFDPRPLAALAERLFPGKGTRLADAWRARQFEYAWLRAAAGRYADFWRLTGDALSFAAGQAGIRPSPAETDQLMRAVLGLRGYPDALDVLRTLRSDGLRLAIVSNATPAMLASWVGNAGMAGLLDRVVSTDAARTYKPDPRAYQLGVDALGLPAAAIVFVASAGWDAAGAKWFGHPTFWVDRSELPVEALGVAPDATGPDLDRLPGFVEGR